MKFVVDFYQSLDTLNLIIFWGIIIVILLLLIFSIILANKNKKLKELLVSKKYELDSAENQTADLKNIDIPIISKNSVTEETIINEKENNDLVKPIEEEKKFVAEEHVMEYNNDSLSLPSIAKIDDNQGEQPSLKIEPKKEINIPTGPYQRNVLREMSLSQTSPIGIVKREDQNEKNINNAKELHDLLHTEEIDNDTIDYYKNKKDTERVSLKIGKPAKEQRIPSTLEEVKVAPHNEISINDTKDIGKPHQNNYQASKETYLAEVSKKLSEANNIDDVDRTEYELKQEEEAIISYEELMRKKNSIKMIDEEEAVISIEELMQRKAKEEKLYNLTEDEENDKFIKELKNFRSDL